MKTEKLVITSLNILTYAVITLLPVIIGCFLYLDGESYNSTKIISPLNRYLGILEVILIIMAVIFLFWWDIKEEEWSKEEDQAVLDLFKLQLAGYKKDNPEVIEAQKRLECARNTWH